MSFFKKIGDKIKEYSKTGAAIAIAIFKKIKDKIKEYPKTAAAIVFAIGGGTLAVAAAPLALAAAGFGSAGVAAGSAAAAWQASIGNVAAGSFFASLQSAGAVGIAASTSAGVGAAGAAVGAGLGAAAEKIFGKKPGPGEDEKPADEEIQALVDNVKEAVVTKLGFQPPEMTATHFLTQADTNTNYFVRVHIGDGKHIHLRINKHFSGTVSLHGVKHNEAGGVAESEQLEYFDQNNY